MSDRILDRLQEFDAAGNALRSLSGHRLKRPIGLALTADGELWAADRNNDRLLRFGPSAAGQPPLLAPKPSKKPLHAAGKIERLKPGKIIREDGARVELPAGALNEDLEISVSEVGDADPDRQSKEEKRLASKLKAASPEVEYGPEGLIFALPVTLSLPYDPAAGLDVTTLKVHYWNPKTKQWEALLSSVDPQRRLVSAQTTHFSLYQVLGLGGGALAADSLGLGEVYAYPNPSRGQSPRFRVEAAGADAISIRVYDVAGALVHEAAPAVGQDHLWDVSGVGTGVYHYVVTAKRGGQTLNKRGKLAVVR